MSEKGEKNGARKVETKPEPRKRKEGDRVEWRGRKYEVERVMGERERALVLRGEEGRRVHNVPEREVAEAGA